MNKEELRKEINEIERIFQSAKYYGLDFKYINTIKYKQPIVYRTFYFFIERIYHSVSVALILDLCKLFDKREKYSFYKLKNKMNENYGNSELCGLLSSTNFEELFTPLDSERIEQLLKKLKAIRDEYYAHFDRTRTEFGEIQINSKETGRLISIAENILKTIELKYFETNVYFNMSSTELGHNIFERLDQWEEYREKYGLLKIKRSQMNTP